MLVLNYKYIPWKQQIIIFSVLYLLPLCHRAALSVINIYFYNFKIHATALGGILRHYNEHGLCLAKNS